LQQKIISNIRRELTELADEKTKAVLKRFFKEKTAFYGVKSALVEKIAARYYPEVKPLGKSKILELCEELLKSDYSEEAVIAFAWSFRLKNEYETEDFARFENWLVNYVNNWAKCDTLCNHTIGSLVTNYPQFMTDLKRWAHSENRWLRRAAAVTLIIPAKEGNFLKDIFEIADILLMDKDDLVQKGYGWLLKDASIKHRGEVFHYVMKNRQVMPRTALRYAIERLPAQLKDQAMEKTGGIK
jgi:3-methyladenine DNA glycosylase AlkD